MSRPAAGVGVLPPPPRHFAGVTYDPVLRTITSPRAASLRVAAGVGLVENALGVLAGVALLAMILRSDELSFLLLIMPGAVVVGLHFLPVFLLTLNRALFAERVAPRERLIAIAMACAGPAGIFVATFFWP
jgi:hypothetical protein